MGLQKLYFFSLSVRFYFFQASHWPSDHMIRSRPLIKGSHQKKKASLFWTLSKSGLDPPPLILDTREVTFVSAHFGHP